MLSEALRLVRVFHDLKQNELAERLGLSKSYLSELETGRKTPTIDVMERYSREFRIPVSSIMFFSEQIERPGSAQRIGSAQTVIASKILDFLRLVERKTEDAE